MQSIELTIKEYEASHGEIQKRIHELNAQIGSSREESCVKRLVERRSTLYTELWAIEYAIRELREYCDRAFPCEANLKTG